MRPEARIAVLGSELEKSRITPGVVSLSSEANLRAGLLGISGSIASSSESPVNRVLSSKKESVNSHRKGHRDRNGKWILYRRGGRGGRCRAAGKHEYLGCGSSRCQVSQDQGNKNRPEQSAPVTPRRPRVRTNYKKVA